MKFLTEAAREAIECRRALKWSYVYAYFTEERMEESQRRLFGLDQDKLETMCDKLSGIAESPLDQYCDLQTGEFLDMTSL